MGWTPILYSIQTVKSCALTDHLNTGHFGSLTGFFSLVFRPPFEFRTIWQPNTNLPFECQTSPVFRWLLYVNYERPLRLPEVQGRGTRIWLELELLSDLAAASDSSAEWRHKLALLAHRIRQPMKINEKIKVLKVKVNKYIERSGFQLSLHICSIYIENVVKKMNSLRSRFVMKDLRSLRNQNQQKKS